MIHYDHLINAEIISSFSIHLTLLKTWNKVYKFWVRPELQSKFFLDLLTTVHYCNCMTWYQVISAWLVNDKYLTTGRQCVPSEGKGIYISKIILFGFALRLVMRSSGCIHYFSWYAINIAWKFPAMLRWRWRLTDKPHVPGLYLSSKCD